jgi:hypothetical protein
MKNRIIEIVELGKPQSIIQREGDPITELIHTHILIEELNEQLLLYNVVGQSEQLKCDKHHWMYRGERLDGRFVCERCGEIK